MHTRQPKGAESDVFDTLCLYNKIDKLNDSAGR